MRLARTRTMFSTSSVPLNSSVVVGSTACLRLLLTNL